MDKKLIPADTHLAARRAFVRTAAQSLASVIPTSVIAISLTSEFWVGVGLGAAGAVMTSLLAGAASYLSIVSNGIPDAYQAHVVEVPRAPEDQGFLARD
jgi:mevalonate kinase